MFTQKDANEHIGQLLVELWATRKELADKMAEIEALKKKLEEANG